MEIQPNSMDFMLITPQQEEYIAYCAVGGILPQEDGFGKKMTVEEFASKLGVNASTLWRWRSSIPNFWDKVNTKRREIGGKTRLTAVWNGVAMKAATGNAECAKLYLANFDPNFRMPTEKIEHDLGNGFADLIATHAKRKVVESQIIDISPNE